MLRVVIHLLQIPQQMGVAFDVGKAVVGPIIHNIMVVHHHRPRREERKNVVPHRTFLVFVLVGGIICRFLVPIESQARSFGIHRDN